MNTIPKVLIAHMHIDLVCTKCYIYKFMIYGCSYHTYLSKNVFKLILQTFCPPPQASLLLTLSETSTAILFVVSAAFIGKWPLLSCKIASLAGGHLVGAVAVRSDSVWD